MVDRRAFALVDTSGNLPEGDFRVQVDRALQRLQGRDAELTTIISALTARVAALEGEPDVDLSGYLTIAAAPELIRDTMGTCLAAGAGITVSVNDPADTITIACTVTAYTDEMARDALGAALTEGAGIDIAVNDGADTITITTDLEETARWVVVRNIDCGAWPSTDFAAGGDTTYALDDGSGSLTYTAVNTGNANAGSTTNGGFFRRNAGDTGADGGSGLRIFHDASVSTTFNTTTTTGPRLGLPLSSLDPNYDPTAEYILLVHITRFTDSSAGTPPANLRAGAHLYAPAGTPTGSTVRVAGAVHGRSAANEAIASVQAPNGNLAPMDAYTFAAGGYNVIGLQWGPSGTVQALAGIYSGGFPDPDDMVAVGDTSMTLDVTAQDGQLNSEATFAWLDVATGSSSTGSVDVMFRRFELLRRVR